MVDVHAPRFHDHEGIHRDHDEKSPERNRQAEGLDIAGYVRVVWVTFQTLSGSSNPLSNTSPFGSKVNPLPAAS